MRTIEIAEATASLGECARRARKEPLVVTRRGRPVAALMAITTADWESVALSLDPEFMAIIERSRAAHKPGTGISTEEMRRRLGLRRGAR